MRICKSGQKNVFYILTLSFVMTMISSVDFDECVSGPCVNGECNDRINSYICVCEAGWTGTHCDLGESRISNRSFRLEKLMQLCSTIRYHVDNKNHKHVLDHIYTKSCSL